MLNENLSAAELIELIRKNIRIGLKNKTSHLGVCLTRQSTYLELEEFLFVENEPTMMAGLKEYEKDLELRLGKSLWEIAEDNTISNGMVKLVDFDGYFADTNCPDIYIATTNTGRYGAGVAYNTEWLRNELQRISGLKNIKSIIVLPSSLHEILVLIQNDIDDDLINGMTAIIQDINEVIVDKEVLLSNQAYTIYFD